MPDEDRREFDQQDAAQDGAGVAAAPSEGRSADDHRGQALPEEHLPTELSAAPANPASRMPASAADSALRA